MKNEIMIDINKVELLIFDMDGTLFRSDKANFEAIKKALLGLEWDVSITEDDVKKYLGEVSEKFYREILPPDKFSQKEEFKKRTREQYATMISNYGEIFLGVLETLKILKERGYKLVLCTNASVKYFNVAVSFLGVKDYFDYMECVQENNLTKSELVKKIQSQFPASKSAIVGDRIHDIEAAKENDALSIGVLYGYGGKEPEQADIVINNFPELLNIFDRRLFIFEDILKKIKRKKDETKAFVIGITGIDTSGKTKFAEAFEKFLTFKNYKTQIINLDDFHNPQKIRYAEINQADNYYNKSFDIKTIVKKLLIPIHQKSNSSIKLNLLDLHTDQYDIEKEFIFDRNTIIIFEGVFLFRKEFSPYIDYKIFIDVSFRESKNRARVRDVPIYGEEVLKKYDEKYLPAQKKYLDEFSPLEVADLIIDNNNWEYPKIKKQAP